MSPYEELEKLKQRFRQLEEENQKLKEDNAYLQFELKELKDRIYGRRKKEDPPPRMEAPAKKRGALFGHLGWFRKTPGQDR